MEQLALDKVILEREAEEWKKKANQMEEEMKRLKAEVDGKWKGKKKELQELVADQSEKVQLRAKIQAERVARQELKESLREYVADAEATSVQHYIKTEEFKAAMVRLNNLWYAAGFDICKL
ncbi:hypothetical protein Dimus_015879 [Dionaea muscipula]